MKKNVQILYTSVLILSLYLFFGCQGEKESARINKKITIDESSLSPIKVYQESSCEKLLGKIRSLEAVNVVEDSSNPEGKVKVKFSGYIDKSNLKKKEEIHSNPSETLEKLSERIYDIATTNGFSGIKKYCSRDSLKVFRWKVDVCSMTTDKIEEKSYTYKRRNHTEHGYEKLDDLSPFKHSSFKYMGKGEGKPRGKVIDNVHEEYRAHGNKYKVKEGHHVVLSGAPRGKDLARIWLEFEKTENGFGLVEISYYEYSS